MSQSFNNYLRSMLIYLQGNVKFKKKRVKADGKALRLQHMPLDLP